MSAQEAGEQSSLPSRTAKRTWRETAREVPDKRPPDERRHDFSEIYETFTPEQIQAQAARCVQCGKPLCVSGCPLHNRIPEWISLAAEGRFLEAAELSRSTSNMPEICSRVCPQERLCEGACILNRDSDPVTIGVIEKFINEYAFWHGFPVEVVPENGLRVAVVGSGPAGLSCADQLRDAGCAVTVFEAFERAGGLLVHGIPAFKLDKRIVERRVQLMRAKGVRFSFNQRLGQNLTLEDLQGKFDAVFLGFGAQAPKSAGVAGADLPGVYDALPFLIEKSLGALPGLPAIEVADKRVVVLGGGDTAMDCLRSAVRAGAKEAVCVYRRDEANMPGSTKDYKNAIEEGATFVFLTNPVEIVAGADGAVSGVQCVRMRLGEPDAGGRRKPEKVPGSEHFRPADIVLVAYGFDPVQFPPASDLHRLQRNDWGGLILDENHMTSVPGIFAGGDAWRGPSLVSHAVRDGRIAAESILNYLGHRSNLRDGPASVH
jgi:glutamate synthase (NADPH) small chain